jgi:hypothetical protein
MLVQPLQLGLVHIAAATQQQTGAAQAVHLTPPCRPDR